MDEEVELPQRCADLGEGGVEAGVVGDVAGQHDVDPTEAASGSPACSSASPW